VAGCVEALGAFVGEACGREGGGEGRGVELEGEEELEGGEDGVGGRGEGGRRVERRRERGEEVLEV